MGISGLLYAAFTVSSPGRSSLNRLEIRTSTSRPSKQQIRQESLDAEIFQPAPHNIRELCLVRADYLSRPGLGQAPFPQGYGDRVGNMDLEHIALSVSKAEIGKHISTAVDDVFRPTISFSRPAHFRSTRSVVHSDATPLSIFERRRPIVRAERASLQPRSSCADLIRASRDDGIIARSPQASPVRAWSAG